MFLFTQVQVFMELRQQVLMARVGIRVKAIESKARPFDAINFVGMHVANSALAVHILLLLWTLVIFPFCWPVVARVVADYVASNFGALLIVIIPMLATMLVKKRVMKYTYGPSLRFGVATDGAARNRRCYGCYDIWALFLAVTKGAKAAAVRIVLFVVIGLLSVLSIAESPLPGWFERYAELDSGSKSYQAMVLQCIFQNNPLMNVAAWELLKATNIESPRKLVFRSRGEGCADSDQDCQQWGKAKSALELKTWTRARNRWLVAIKLMQ